MNRGKGISGCRKVCGLDDKVASTFNRRPSQSYGKQRTQRKFAQRATEESKLSFAFLSETLAPSRLCG
jgi:hypothetical protein